ncbi:MAG: UbiX family flavin prenyltransferase [Paraburkholderia fungorum]|nr:UbiX family flavin prenyltransferase [Paraburkholderia fungorum]
MSTGARRLIVGVTGASGSVIALRLLQLLRQADDWEVHLVLSPAAILNAKIELNLGQEVFEPLAHRVYSHKDISAPIASGSFRTEGMVIVPCSMNTLSAVAHGASSNLIARAADVVLKERRKLVLVAREAPLNLIQLRNMTAATEAGAVVFPPVPSFYLGEISFQQMVTQIAGRVLDQFGIDIPDVFRWNGIKSRGLD